MRYAVGPVTEIPPGSRKIVYPVPGPGIGVFNVNGAFYAVKNTCPHMGAPLCYGMPTGTTQLREAPDGRLEVEWVRAGEILTCPWHHWEFEIATGRTVFPSKRAVATYDVIVAPASDADPRLETYPVVVDAAIVYLELGAGRDPAPGE